MITRTIHLQINRPAYEALAAVGKHFTSISPKLRAVVQLRVSQINGCVYCVDLHSRQRHEHGESQQRLDCLPPVGMTFFDDWESAAAWAGPRH